jgi:hypothetical protein
MPLTTLQFFSNSLLAFGAEPPRTVLLQVLSIDTGTTVLFLYGHSNYNLSPFPVLKYCRE